MTRGIRVLWPGENNQIDEIEYFCGIDIHQLDQIPQFNTVPAEWPQHEGGTLIEYAVDAHCVPAGPGQVHLIVHYDQADQENELVQEWNDEIVWGTNTVVLEEGIPHGICHWQSDGAADYEEVAWEAFDLGANQARQRAAYLGSRRQARFRAMILNCDNHQCVLTGEATIKALDAAHLIPAAKGENDVSFNGITLRADLHRLFDAFLFTIAPDGGVVIPEQHPGLSAAYTQLLQNCGLPAATLQRVGATLASPEFQNRGP